MESSGEQTSFNLESTIEQKPFENPAVQSVFVEWCKINDGIEPQYIDRTTWEDRTGEDKILEDRGDGKKKLYIPQDLQLWEMVDVMEAVDADTFSHNPERRTAKAEELRHLGEKFENAGIYIAQRIDAIDQGKHIAEGLAVHFYDYGKSLTTGSKPETASPLDDLGQRSIPADKIEDVDRWLAGDEFYKVKLAKVDNSLGGDRSNREQVLENERRRTLSQYFRVAGKSFELRDKDKAGELHSHETPKPWELNTSVHDAFLDKAESQMKREIEKPKTELNSSIFRRGMELLQRNMPIDSLPDNVKQTLENWENADTKLREGLDIDGLRELFDKVRANGDVEELAHFESSMAELIQLRIQALPFKLGSNNPSEMLAMQEINCVGASTLGGAYLSELGIDYYVAALPTHSILFLRTSSGEIKYMDMLATKYNHMLTDDVISGQKPDGTPITVEDIAAFSDNTNVESMKFSLTSEEYKKWQADLGYENRDSSITIFKQEIGQQFQILSNTANALFTLNRRQEAAQFFRQALALVPDKPTELLGLGHKLSVIGETEEAISTLQKAIALGEKNANSFRALGNAFSDLDRSDDAIEAYKEAIARDPTNQWSYFALGTVSARLGRLGDVKVNYEKILELADPEDEKNKDLIEYVSGQLNELSTYEESQAA